MPILARLADLSHLILVLFFLAINLHLRLQCLQQILSELALETQAIMIFVTLFQWVCIIFALVFLRYVRGVWLTVLAILLIFLLAAGLLFRIYGGHGFVRLFLVLILLLFLQTLRKFFL